MPNYNFEDIYVLQNILNKPVLKANSKKLVTGGAFCLYLRNKEINIAKSISKLLDAEFIRESTPKEFLKYFTVSELNQLLNKKPGLTKSLLISEAKAILTDEEIKKHNKYMTFYIVSDLGNDILTKYKNLILFFEKSNDIFLYGESNGRFDASFFFKNYTLNPLDEIFNYYKDKRPDIAGRICYIKEDYNIGILYAVQSISKIVATGIDDMKERSYFFDSFNLRRRFVDEWILETYSRVDLSEDNIIDLIKHEYNQQFQYGNLISYNLFEELQFATMMNEYEKLEKISSEISELVSNEYFRKSTESELMENDRDSSSIIEEYYKKTAKDLALLDILIGHLDLELLYGLRNRVDIMINEKEEIEN